jgi:hypothetical protein
MSSTIGYGVKISNSIFTNAVYIGDWTGETETNFPSLVVVSSRPEYSDEEEQVFVLVKDSVTEAGNGYSTKSASAFNPVIPDLTALDEFLQEVSATDASKPSWFLVDYYPES